MDHLGSTWGSILGLVGSNFWGRCRNAFGSVPDLIRERSQAFLRRFDVILCLCHAVPACAVPCRLVFPPSRAVSCCPVQGRAGTARPSRPPARGSRRLDGSVPPARPPARPQRSPAMSRPGPRKVMEGLGGESQGPPQAAKASRQAYDKNATYRRFPFHLGQVGGPGGGHFLR